MSKAGKIIIFIVIVLFVIGLIGGIIKIIIAKHSGEEVEVMITGLDDYEDFDYGRTHIVYGEIISDGDNQGKKVKFSTALENEYHIGDIIAGKYYRGDFLANKE